MHLVGGAVPDAAEAGAHHAAPDPPPADAAARLASLETAVAALARELGEVKKRLGEEP
jgi:uncharacterized protein YceH (UPF0502 family)